MADESLVSTVSVRSEVDAVTCRQCAKHIAARLSFSKLDQIRIATSVSELARNIYQYSGAGAFHFYLRANAQGQLDGLTFEAKDNGKGIKNLDRILDGSYVSSSGMGVGLSGAKRLMDELTIDTSSAGTRVYAIKCIQPARPFPTSDELRQLRDALTLEGVVDPFQAIVAQGEELLLTTGELQAKQQELEAANLELENTNRGVVALYSELEQTAQELKKASESKSRFFSSMTHEFRTPINIIENISTLMLDGSDGVLNAEQMKQMRFISDAASDLSALVNELLDLAEVQSKRIEIEPSRFDLTEFLQEVETFTAALLFRYPKIKFLVDLPNDGTVIETDRSRLFQILRNLISNAFKYTLEGHVCLKVRQSDAETLEFCVADTGIGIAEENQVRVFEEFCRIKSPGLTQVEGTGLGLPLAQQLASLLKGSISLTSTLGVGSEFCLQLPRIYEAKEEALDSLYLANTDILLVDDSEADRYVLWRLLVPLGATVTEAATGFDAIDKLSTIKPDIIFLDLDLPDLEGHEIFANMNSSLQQRVIINTSKSLNEQERLQLEPLCMAILNKSDLGYQDRVRYQLKQFGRHFNVK